MGVADPGVAVNLDARDLTAQTPGALRGGSHVHVFSPDGEWVSFTYNDALLADSTGNDSGQDGDQRNIGVSVPRGPVVVPPSHPRNHDGDYFNCTGDAHDVPSQARFRRCFAGIGRRLGSGITAICGSMAHGRSAHWLSRGKQWELTAHSSGKSSSLICRTM